ncbi:MAG: FAD-dependent oxidoreductase [Solirubrobacterales bacterium]|nr:FAD-dependent oxidoreductase [Solirubrobacterales bacterium]
MVVPAQAVALRTEDGHYAIGLADGSTVNSRAVIVATGAQYRKLELSGLERYEGLGVYYAATQAEAHLCAQDPVLIVGGGNSADQAAMFLSQHASSCRLAIRGGDLTKSMSRYLIDELERNPRAELFTQTEIAELDGAAALEAVVVRDSRTGERRALDVRALFRLRRRRAAHRLAAGPRGHGRALLHAHGRGRPQRGARAPWRGASVPARDERARALRGRRRALGSVKRVASAVGEGSMAIRLVHQRLVAR